MTFIDQIPLWLVYLVSVGFSLLAAQLGFQIGLWRHHRTPEGKRDVMTGPLVGGLLGLLAFMLAFSTSYTLTQFDKRRKLVVTDANAIGTAYLRSGYLNEPDQAEVRELLHKYVNIRLSYLDLDNLESATVRSESIQDRLWTIAVQNGRDHPEAVTIGLFGESINDMIDVHSSRLSVSVGSRIPPLMWSMLYGIVFIAFLLIGVASSADGKRNYFTLILFALGFATVLALIIDLDRPQQGLFSVSQKAMLDLQRQIENFTP
jgi:hypothetical protein